MRKLTAMIAALAMMSGCFTSHQTRRVVQQPRLSATDLTFPTGEGKVARADQIVEVELEDGSVLEFAGYPSLDGDLVLRGDVVVARDDDRLTTSPVSVPWGQVRSVAVQQSETKFNALNTLLAVGVSVGLLAGLAALAWNSQGAGSGGSSGVCFICD